MTQAKLNAHIRELCTPQNIDICEERCPGQSHSEATMSIYYLNDKAFKGILWIENLRTRRGYWAALHELGHWHRQGLKGRAYFDQTPMLKKEVEAWEWAVETSLIPMSVKIKHILRKEWLGTYLAASFVIAYPSTQVRYFLPGLSEEELPLLTSVGYNVQKGNNDEWLAS